MFRSVVVTGSLAFDNIMSMPGRFKDHILPEKIHILNVSFIMNTFRQEYGGTGGNISWNLGLLGTPNSLVAAAGNDFSQYRKHFSKLSLVDISHVKVYKNLLTARGFVTTDKDNNQIWGFYEGAMKMSKSISVTKYLAKDVVLMIAPNDPSAMARYVEEAIKKKTPYIFDPAFNIPHFDNKVLKKAIKNSKILIGNDYEIELIKSKLDWSSKDLVKNTEILITTLGSKGARIENKSKVYNIAPAKPNNESDPTGAGDAFRAGFLAGFVKDFPLQVCGRMGALTAVYTVEKYGTQTHTFTKSQFINRYKQNYDDDFEFDL